VTILVVLSEVKYMDNCMTQSTTNHVGRKTCMTQRVINEVPLQLILLAKELGYLEKYVPVSGTDSH
jgi:hypothetical protein